MTCSTSNVSVLLTRTGTNNMGFVLVQCSDATGLCRFAAAFGAGILEPQNQLPEQVEAILQHVLLS